MASPLFSFRLALTVKFWRCRLFLFFARDGKNQAQRKHSHSEFQQVVLQIFQNIETQTQGANYSPKQTHKTQREIQETTGATATNISELDKRVTATEERDKVSKGSENYPGRKSRMERRSRVRSSNCKKNRSKAT